jgi:hypothetical protein
MNLTDVMKYGDRTTHMTLERVPMAKWDVNGVCGWWSVKDIVAHLASFEHILIDVLQGFLDGGPTPTLDRFLQIGGEKFNEIEVAARHEHTSRDVLAEYESAFARSSKLAERIPADVYREVGRLPWYGPEYALDDLVVYQYYGHRREHMAQVAVYSDTLKK